jgi:hypothetical protein
VLFSIAAAVLATLSLTSLVHVFVTTCQLAMVALSSWLFLCLFGTSTRWLPAIYVRGRRLPRHLLSLPVAVVTVYRPGSQPVTSGFL